VFEAVYQCINDAAGRKAIVRTAMAMVNRIGWTRFGGGIDMDRSFW
jgi:hypothetical protein